MSIRYRDCVSSNYNKLTNKIQFNTSVYCVLSFYFGKLKNYDAGSFDKIRFEFHQNLKEKHKAVLTHFRDLLPEERKKLVESGDYLYQNYIDDITNTLFIHRRFDFENWFEQDKVNKKRLIGKEVHNAMLYLADNYGWNKHILIDIYQSYIEANYETNGIPKKLKAKSSPNRKYKAAIYVEYDIDEFRVYNIFYKKNGDEIDKNLIYTIDFNKYPYDFTDMIFDILKGKTKWEKDEFVLYDKSGKELSRKKLAL